MAVVDRTRDDFDAPVHVYEPHKASLPPLRPYFREFWRRRRFAFELSRSTQKAGYLDSPLGKIWLVLNPLLLAFVYFILISVVSSGSETPAYESWLHIVAGLFTWYLVQNCMTIGATSITAGGKLILNQAFPRALLPFSSVVSSVMQYLPTIPVYLVFYALGFLILDSDATSPPNWTWLLLPVLIALLIVTGFGLAMIFATLTVYYRDTSKFLAYIVRIGLYMSPVLFTADQMIEKFGTLGEIAIIANPVGPGLACVTGILTQSEAPSPLWFGLAVAWAVVLLVVGGWVFVSRERDFAVRL